MTRGTSRILKNDVAHGLTVSPPNRDKLTMRAKPLKTRGLILSLSKDEAKILCFFSSLLDVNSQLLELAKTHLALRK